MGSIHQVESLLQVVNFFISDVDDGSQRQRVDDGMSGGFQNFQSVKGLQQAVAGDQHAVVFHHQRRVGGIQLPGNHSGSVDVAVGQLLNVPKQDVYARFIMMILFQGKS